MRPALRPLLVVLAALAVWLLAWPAFAAAPICDVRGASALAPAPTLDASDAAIDISTGDVGTSPDACVDVMDRDDSFHQGRTPEPLPSPAGADLMPIEGRVHITSAGVSFHPPAIDVQASKSPARDRLERPPRLGSSREF
jgi:hypothetical protein